MAELIDKQVAIFALMERFKRVPTNAIIAKDVIENLPSVQPEQRWIPCSERLPKPGYCITSNEYYGVDKDVYYDGHFWNADENAYEVVAWMPLPEPYAERRTDGTR